MNPASAMQITCPIQTCRTPNDPDRDSCVRCASPLRSYALLSSYPARLFNQGLAAARHGQTTRARDLFAAVVHWCPVDVEARNALAMACFALGDFAEARHHWEYVLARIPADALAKRGLARLESMAHTISSAAKQTAKPKHKGKPARRANRGK